MVAAGELARDRLPAETPAFMSTTPSKSHRRKKPVQDAEKKNVLNKLVENDYIRKVSYAEYREKVRDVYDGPQGAILNIFSTLSLHRTLGERLLRERKFDLRGARNILDVGSGAGQIAEHLLKYADRDAAITCFDLSEKMIHRARKRLKSYRPRYLVADMTRLPFADGTFDCVTCGYVLEHVPDPRIGLAELRRVMQPGGRMLLITSEDNFGGACTSRVWRCQTYRRSELRQICEEIGLAWKQELWFSKMHRVFKAGGICVELQRR
jgi:ubiquinone/menaquinone biosynthesis C-methylase UbiE